VFWGGPAKNVIIEIHWNIMNSNLENTSHEVDWIWNDAFWENDAYSLRLEKEFLYLVGHMMIQHGTSPTRLIWLYDLCLFLEKYFYNMDWDFIFENSTLLGWNRVLVESIQNCADYFPSQFTDLAITKFPGNFSKQQKGQINRGWIPRAMRGMSVDRGIRTAKGMIFPGFSYMQWRYHLATRKYILMYYPKRWFELVKGVINKK